MFMRNNRALNGAPQPEQVERDEAAREREQESIPSNDMNFGSPQKRTFEPDLMTLEAIDRRHKMGGLDEAEWPDYEQYVPVGHKAGK